MSGGHVIIELRDYDHIIMWMVAVSFSQHRAFQHENSSENTSVLQTSLVESHAT